MSSFVRNLVVWVVLGSLMVYVFNNVENSSAREQISYSQFKQEVLSDRVAKVVYKGDQMTIIGDRLDGSKFETTHPIFKKDDVLDNAIEENGVIAIYEKVEQPSIFSQLLVGAFPILLLLAIFFFFMRQMQGGMSGKGGPMSFGRSKAKLMEGGKVKTTFKDVAGCEEAKQDVQELVDFLRDPTKFQKLGGKIPRGVLMVGPPGTGKTLIARAVAGEAKVPFFTISGSDFVEMFVGVGASRVRDMFEQAKKQSPCIVFIDEIDAVGRHRGAGLGGGHDEREQTLNQLLVEMDGFEGNDGVIVIAATNRPDVLDPALLRPGRFDRQVVVDLPDIRGREAILKVHMRKVPLAADVDPLVIARGTPGFSGADLANLINEAALFAARYSDKKIDQSHLDLAKDKIMMGAERKSMILSEGSPFLGRSASSPAQIRSDQTSKLIDSEVKAIIDSCYERAEKLLKENLDKLNIMADALLKYETIGIEQIDDIMEGATPREPKGWSDDTPSGKSSKKTSIKGTAEEL